MIEDTRGAVADRSALLERRLARPDAGTVEEPGGRLSEAPLSQSQERLWLTGQIGSSLVEYNVPMGWWLSGPLDADALRDAVRTVVQRHDILRTRYVGEVGGADPRQCVEPHMPFEWAVTDLSQLPRERARERAEEIADTTAARPFDLATGPNLRAELVQVGADEWFLTIVVHHIAFDGWSETVLERELSDLYAAFVRGEPSPLAPLGLQYADVAVAQRRKRSTPAARDGLEYWRRQLSGLRRADLPTDHPRPDRPGGGAGELSFDIPASVADGLQDIGRSCDTTLYMTILAVYHLLLSRYTGSTDVTTGTPIGNRDDVAAEDLIGFFVDLIVLRTDLSGDPTFADLLGRVRRTAMDAYAHSDTPFDRMIDVAEETNRAPGSAPLFQTLFAVHNEPRRCLELPAIEVSAHTFRTIRAMYDFGLSVLIDGDGGLRGCLVYGTDLFDHSTIEDLVEGFVALLEDITATGAHRPLDEYAPHVRRTSGAVAVHDDTPSGSGNSRPASALQATIAEMFGDLLGTGAVGVDDDLRALGVDSLVAVRATGRLRELLGSRIALRTVVKCRTVVELAAELGRDATPAEEASDHEPDPNGVTVELSPAQQSIWFLERLRPGRTDYLMPFVWHLNGPLAPDTLRRALDHVVARHEPLRARFAELDGRPVQHLPGPMPVPWHYTDLSGLSTEDADDVIGDWHHQEVSRPFDLGEPPLIRARLARLAADRHVLMVTVHHIAFDGWSTSVLLSDLDTAYSALAADDPLPPAPRVRYRDHVNEQRRWLAGPEARAQLDRWTRRLADAPRLDLPTDGADPAARPGGRHTLVVPDPVTQRLRQLVDEENTTLFAALFSAFAVLLGRLTDQRDLVVGVPSAGRSRPDFDQLIGLFLNTLVLRTDLSGEPGFAALLGRVHVNLLEALGEQDVPFERLVEALKPARDIDRNPVVDVLFNFGNLPTVRPRIGEAWVEESDIDSVDPKFWLTIYGGERDGHLHLDWVYRADVFGPGRVEAMAAQYAHLLAQIADQPERPIEEYSLCAPELGSTLPDPTAPLSTAPPDTTVVDAFRRTVARHGGLVAVTDGERTRTFDELLADASTIAATVAGLDLPPNAVVALSVPPSFGLAAGMMAVLMAEHPLLVLDPEQPRARRELLVREAGVRAVLTGTGGPTAAGTLDVRAELVPHGVVPVLPEPGRKGDRAAYLTFTSGSTGVPKCVVGSQYGLAHFLFWQRDTFGVGPGDRMAQLTALSFDVLYRDVLLPLVSGATLGLPPCSWDDPDRLFAWLREEGITYLHAVPSVLRATLSAAHADRTVPSLRRLFLAGEPLARELVDEVWRRVAPAELVNLYGPTETTLAKLARRMRPTDRDRTVNVGRPLPGTQALVLGPRGRLCSVGEIGEVVLRTPARGLGYLNAAPEDRARFLVNPFTGDADDVLFRTGDRGRYRPDGTLDLLGRVDDQVKVRGIRIEPGEIETVLCRHPAVRAAAVAVRRAGDTDGLVAYVEIADGDLDVPSVRGFLGRRLPAALIPGVFHRVDRLPRTASGKLDRRALPALSGTPISSPAHQHRSARTPTEASLVDIWQRVLGISRIGVHDNFFDLGGDSLRLVHVTSLGRDRGIPLDVRDYYENQTVAGLGALAAERTGCPAPERDGPLVRLKPDGAARPLFCVHPSGGSAAWYAALARVVPPERPVLAFELPDLRVDEPPYGIEELAATYVKCVLDTGPGPYALLGWSLGGMIAFEMARQLTAAGHEVAPLVLLEPTLPGDEASAANHRTSAELYRKAVALVEHAAEALPGSDEHSRRRAEIARFFESIDWPAYEAELAHELPLRACGNLHAAYADYRPGPHPGEVHLVLSEEGRRASGEHRSPVLHDSADRYLQRWRSLVDGELAVHDSGADHMTMVGPGNAGELADLCERLLAEG